MKNRISIVTPNLNGAVWLGSTMDSIFSADHGGLDYVVIDGGSTDGSQEVIAARAGRLSHWVSEVDNGLYHALNKGFAMTVGDIMGWLNSGDYLFPHSLRIVDDIFTSLPEVQWLTSRIITFLDAEGRIVKQGLSPGYTRNSFLRGENLPGFSAGPDAGHIQQEATFWRRGLWERAGGRLDTTLRVAADFELWARFFPLARLCAVTAPLGAFRKHAGQMSATLRELYLQEASEVLRRDGGIPDGKILASLRIYARRALPRVLRPAAVALGLFDPALTCDFDFDRARWRLSEF